MITIQTEAGVDAIDVAQCEGPGPFIWNRAGEKRLIPLGVIENAKDIAAEGLSLVEHDIMDYVPKHWTLVYWNQCTPLYEHSRVRTKTGHNPLFRNLDQKSGSRDQNSPAD